MNGKEPEMVIDTDRARIDVALVHRYLSQESYWAQGIDIDTVRKAIQSSLCFGGYLDGRQVAFGRVVTDYATSGHLKDVFVMSAFRGRGFGKILVEAMVSHPQVRDLQLSLATDDAHRLYARYGFILHPHPERAMVRIVDRPG